MIPRSQRMVTPGSLDGRTMLQLRTACAERVEGAPSRSPNVSVNVVVLSTPVRRVLSIDPVTVEGLARLFAGLSYKTSAACE